MLLVGAALAAAAARLAVAERVEAPWYIDEFLYAGRAREIAAGGAHWAFNLSSLQFELYPTLISPAWLADDIATAYTLAKTINVVLLLAVAGVVYVWAKGLVRPAYAALAAALVLLLPAYLYSAMLISENAFFPAAMLAFFAVARALERPTLARQGLALAAAAFAAVTRAQGVVLLPVLLTALVVFVFLSGGRRFRRGLLADLRPYAPTFAILGLGLALYAAYVATTDATARSALGVYHGVLDGQYAASDLAYWVGLHGSLLALSVGLVPVSALVVLLARSEAAGRAERAFLAVASSATVWFTLEIGAYSAAFANRLEERYLAAVAPLLVLAFAVWLDRGLPRPRIAVAVGLLLPVIPLLRWSLDQRVEISNTSDAFTMLSLPALAGEIPGLPDRPAAAALAMAVLAAAVFVAVPRSVGWIVAVVVAVYLVECSRLTFDAQQAYAQGARTIAGVPEQEAWIDDTVGRDARVVFVFPPDPEPERIRGLVLQTAFWNRSVRAVHKLAPIELCCVANSDAVVSPEDGRIVAARREQAQYAVSTGAVELAGDEVARMPPLLLQRFEPPLRLAVSVGGVFGDGWIGERAFYRRYWGSGPSTAIVRVARTAWTGPNVPGRVQIVVGGLGGRRTAMARWVVNRGAERTFRLPTPRPPFQVEVRVEPTFSPSQFGIPDSRQLGAQVSFTFEPR